MGEQARAGSELENGVSAVAPVRPEAWADVLRWRKEQRRRLIEERKALNPQARREKSARIASLLDLTIARFSGRIVSAFWPTRGEPDLRDWAIRVAERGGRIALPVVIQKGWPLEFRIWSPGDPLERGPADIFFPASGPAVQPDVMVIPGVGYDDDSHRLGYGGGFFDRTLATMARRPVTVGVCFAEGRLATIYPQPHDVQMDVIVTD
jgi:5,10-methenyltetrahydrofolate synthetase